MTWPFHLPSAKSFSLSPSVSMLSSVKTMSANVGRLAALIWKQHRERDQHSVSDDGDGDVSVI